MNPDYVTTAQLEADLLASIYGQSITPVPNQDTSNQERLPLKPHDGIWQGPQGHQTAWYLEDPGPGPNGEVAVKGTPVGSDGSPLPFEGWYYADPTDDTAPTPIPDESYLPPGGDIIQIPTDGEDAFPIPGGYDGFQFDDPTVSPGIDGNNLTGLEIIGDEGLGESGAALTPFPIPARKTLGGTVGVQQSARSLGRSSSNRSLNISTGYPGIPSGFAGIPSGFTGIPPGFTGVGPGFTGVGPGFTGVGPGFAGIPSGYTGVNPLKVNNRVRRTGDLARGSGRFNRTLST